MTRCECAEVDVHGFMRELRKYVNTKPPDSFVAAAQHEGAHVMHEGFYEELERLMRRHDVRCVAAALHDTAP